MRPEQITQLATLEEQLIDVFVKECQPKKWPGMANAGDRGDRYWFKKNALSTLTLAARIQTVLRDGRADGGAGETKPPSSNPDGLGEKSIEQEADELVKAGVAILARHAKKRKA